MLRFYNTRDTQPELWYPVVDGVPQKFDDLPAAYRGNIDPQPPLDGRAPGSQPAMTDQDLDDLEAFLRTLTDDYIPGQDNVASAVPAFGRAGSLWLALSIAALFAIAVRPLLTARRG